MKRVKKLLAAILMFSMVVSCFAAVDWTSQAEEKFEVKNVIFMIGDGMGDGALAAGRMLRSELNLDKIDKLGYLNTNNIDDKLTDSAAGGTALATGVRTTNGTVGLDKDGAVLENLSEWMKQKDKKLGLVSSTYVVDATPAVFAAHTASRNNYADVAKAMVDLGVDVILGGGSSQFDYAINNNGTTTTGIQYAKTNGYQYVTNKTGLNDIDSGKVLGLFTSSAMNYPSKKNAEEPNLAELTEKTLSLLENENGFFAMIEGGRIDGAAHNNEAANLQDAMLEFDDAIKVAMDYADAHEGTLIVITADHETGGVKVGSTVSGPQVQFSTGDHTTDPVPYYVYGAGMEHFEGLTMNTEIAPAIKKAVTEGTTVNSGAAGDDSSSDDSDDSYDGYTPDDNASGLDTPHTGDNSNPLVWVALLAVCGGMLVVSIIYCRKKRNCV